MESTRGLTPRKLLALLAVAGVIVATAPAARPEASPGGNEAISAALYEKALKAQGETVLQYPGHRVVRVVVKDHGDSTVLYRIRVGGHFPPRPLRYEVYANSTLVGYGTPTPDQKAVRTVTRDIDEDDLYSVNAMYEGGPLQPFSGPPVEKPASSHQEPAHREPARSAVDQIPDPSLPGPYAVTSAEYSLGDQVYQPTDIGDKIELTASVHYPTGLPDGPYPMALFLHGNHVTCYKGERKVRFEWPCKTGFTPIPNYAGYDYIAEPLASHGFIVVSVSANGVNALGDRVYDTGMRQRGELLEKHMDLWKEWSTTGGGPFGDTFVGKVDMTHVGTMGHSRGGEGVVWHRIVDEERANPYGIDAVLALAPVDFTRPTINNVTFGTVLPTCDGDVYDLQGVHFFDDSRYSVPGDPTPKHTLTVFGANHNYFNKVWSPSSPYPGGSDDGEFGDCVEERLTEKAQRKIGKAYVVGFFRRYVQNDMTIDPMWTGAGVPNTIEANSTLVSYLAPDTPTFRRDVLRYTEPSDLSQNDLGGDVRAEGLSRYGWCANVDLSPCLTGQVLDIHFPGLSEGLFGWADHTGVLSTDLPLGSRDVSNFDAFQFRTALTPGYQENGGIQYQDLVVALVDGNGNEAEVIASEVGNEALHRTVNENRRRPKGKALLNQLRFPLDAFDGVDLGDVQTVEIRFERNLTGVIQIADVAFSRGGVVIP